MSQLPSFNPGALRSAETAAYVGVTPKTLANWRAAGIGPVFIRLGAVHGRVRYRQADLDAWLASRVVGQRRAA